jgi:hypothetical protein
MGGSCGMHGGHEKCIENYSRKTERKEPVRTVDVGGS